MGTKSITKKLKMRGVMVACLAGLAHVGNGFLAHPY